MKKLNNKGFMLAETLIVTSFVAGMLIYVYIQFTNLNKNYNDSYIFNTVEGLYALDDVKDYVLNNMEYIRSVVTDNSIDITNCDNFDDTNYCRKLLELENIETIIVSKNKIPESTYSLTQDNKFIKFMKSIKEEGSEKYRLIAKFKNSTYATIRFGDSNE